MSNKIDGVESRPVQVSPGTGARAVAGRSSEQQSAPKAPGKGDVHITDAARTLASLEQSVKDMPEVDDMKVALMRDSLRDGNYKIDSQRVADKFLRMEQELSGGRRGKQ